MSRTIFDISLSVGSGITPLRSNKKYWTNGIYPWLKTEQLGDFLINDTTEYISQIALDETSIKLWQPNTISVAMYGEGKTRGSVSIINKTMATNQACCNIIVNEEKADNRFLYYWLKSNYRQLRNLSSGVRKNLNSDDIKNFPFKDFSLIIQKNIANVLFVIDKKIQNNNTIIKELEAMAKTLYNYWFMQFDFPNENGKPYKSTGGAMVYNEELKREIPEGWEVGIIGDCLDKVPNANKIDATNYSSMGKVPIIDQSKDFIAGFTCDNDAILSLEDGGIIFGDHTRVVKFISFDFARGADGTQVIISNDKDRLPQLLFYQIIKSIDLSNYGYARHYKFLKDTMLVIPKSTQSQLYKKIVKPQYDKIKDLIFENQELASLRDWLLPMLMNGQATVE